MHHGDEDKTDPQNAFRKAEKKYQLHWHQIFRYRNGRRQGGKLQVVPTDFTEVLDPRDQAGASVFTSGTTKDGHTFLTVPDHPGFVLLPGVLTKSKQQQLIQSALTQYLEPPANTNHTRQYGKLVSLWDAAQRDLYLGAADPHETSEGHASILVRQWVSEAGGPSAQKLLKKLRWCTLGPHFNWTERVYEGQELYTPLPEELRALAIRLCAAVADCPSQQIGAADWNPDVALINYYRQGDTLGGHKDDVEQDQTAPIVALSLGCSAIFLLGGQTKEEEPLAISLRSGDAVIMSGPARKCYHGVPRVFDEDEAPWSSPMKADSKTEDFAAFTQHMRSTRINISIRASR